jgi:hypothetical protein
MLKEFITKGVSYACSKYHALLLTSIPKLHITMALGHLFSVWIDFLTPSSIDFEQVSFQALISTPSSFPPILFSSLHFLLTSTFIVLMDSFGIPTITMVHFHFQFFPKRQNTIKKKYTYYKFYKYFSKIQFRSHLPI